MPAQPEPQMLADFGAPAPKAPRRSRTKKPAAQWSVVAFGATWCAPWPLLKTSLAALKAGGVPVQTIDVDADGAAAERHRIVTLPTILLLRDGQERRRVTGAVSEAELRAYMGR